MKKAINSFPLIVLFFIFLIGCISVYRIQQEKELERQFITQENINLPKFSFQNLFDKNNSLTDKDLVQNKFSLLNIFASWCTTCRLEHDILVELSYRNIDVYGIAYQDIDESTIKYLKETKNPYKKVGVDRKGDSAKILFVKGVPETILVNQFGKIIYRHQGGLDKEFVSFIDNLIKQ